MKNCQHENQGHQSIHYDSTCSCHLSPPCSYCTDQELVCFDCGEVIEEYREPILSKNSEVWQPNIFKPTPCGNGIITDYTCNSQSGSSMIFIGTYTGEVTNEDLLKFFGDGTFGHRFGFCNRGHFYFTKITD